MSIRWLVRHASAPVITAVMGVALSWAAGAPVPPQNTVLVNRVGPSGGSLFIANADGSDEHLLFADSKFEYNASFSADGQWVVFTSEREGSADIYRVRVDGSGRERLTDNPAFDDQAAFSPDGRQVAFVSARGSGKTDIWILDLATRKSRNLTGAAALRVAVGKLSNHYRPAWSPDGRWLAFSSDRGTYFEPHTFPAPGWEHIQRASVYVLRTDGSGLRKISNDAEFAGSPKWSADGRQVVYYTGNAEHTFAARFIPIPDSSQIVAVDVQSGARTEHSSGPGFKLSPQFVGSRIGYLLKAAGRAELLYSNGERVASTGGQIRNPAWSADGRRIVFQRMQFELQQGQPFYSADRQFLLRFSGEFPAVSANRKVTYTPFAPDGGGEAAPGLNFSKVGVYVSELDGSNRKQIFLRDGNPTYAPSWSPDGQSIVVGMGTYLVGRQTKPAQLLLMNVDGSQARTITDDKINSGFPSFSPDGKHIAYRIWSKDERGLRVMDLTDGSIRTLTTERDNFPFYSPSGDRICFTRNIGEGEYDDYDIFSIRSDGTDLRQLTTALGNDSHCAWSPDGRRILFSSARFGFRDEAFMYDGSPQPYAELFVMRADGSDQKAVTSDRWEEGTPAWAP